MTTQLLVSFAEPISSPLCENPQFFRPIPSDQNFHIWNDRTESDEVSDFTFRARWWRVESLPQDY